MEPTRRATTDASPAWFICWTALSVRDKSNVAAAKFAAVRHAMHDFRLRTTKYVKLGTVDGKRRELSSVTIPHPA